MDVTSEEFLQVLANRSRQDSQWITDEIILVRERAREYTEAEFQEWLEEETIYSLESDITSSRRSLARLGLGLHRTSDRRYVLGGLAQSLEYKWLYMQMSALWDVPLHGTF